MNSKGIVTLKVFDTFSDEAFRVSVEEDASFASVYVVVMKHFEDNKRQQPHHQQQLVIKYEDPEGELVTISSDTDLREAISSRPRDGTPLKLFVVDRLTTSSILQSQHRLTHTTTASPTTSSTTTTATSTTPEMVSRLWMMKDKVLASLSREQRQSLNALFGSGCVDAEDIVAALNAKEGPLVRSVWPRFIDLLIHSLNDQKQQQTTTETAATSSSHKHGILCSQCNKEIVGARYRCTVCDGYNLCETCEQMDVHTASHYMIKSRRPSNTIDRAADTIIKQVSSTTPVVAAAPAPAPPAAPSQVYKAEFVLHTTLPPGSVTGLNQRRIKLWKVRNCGTEEWPVNCKVVQVSGPTLALSAATTPGSRAPRVPNAKPGAVVDVAIDVQTPGVDGGDVVTTWVLQDPEGKPFVMVNEPLEFAFHVSSTAGSLAESIMKSTMSLTTTGTLTPPVVPAAAPVVVPVAAPVAATVTASVSSQPAAVQQAPPPAVAVVVEPIPVVVPAPVAVTVMPAPPPPKSEQEMAMDKMREMGFDDFEKNKKALAKFKGNVEQAIDYLLTHQ